MKINFKTKRKRLEEKFENLHETTNRKDAVEYLFYKKEGLLSELKEKINSELIKDFQVMGYIRIKGNNYVLKG